MRAFILAGLVMAGAHAEGAEKRTLTPPFAMPEMVDPKFPERVFDIRNHGATAEGMNTEAIGRTIEECAKAGGGRVLIPAGTWRTGPVRLQSNVELHLAEGAVLSFSDRFEDYLPVVLVMRGGVEAYSFSPLIYAKDCENIAVTGKGTLLGNGKAWWDEMKKVERDGGVLQGLFDMAARGVPAKERVFDTRQKGLRPHFVQPIDCKNVLLEDFTIKDGPAWTINPIRCENLTVRGVTVSATGVNTDGIDPEMCRNVLIEDCQIDSGDDCIAIKSGRDAEGWRMQRPTENVIIRRVRMTSGRGSLVIGSEISGGVRNVFVYDCEVTGTLTGPRIKTNPGRGGFVENVWFQDIKLWKMKNHAIIVTMAYGLEYNSTTAVQTKIANINFKNIMCEGSGKGIAIVGDAKLPPKGILFENVQMAGEVGFVCSDAEDVRLDEVTVAQATGPAFLFKATKGVAVKDLKGKGDPLVVEE